MKLIKLTFIITLLALTTVQNAFSQSGKEERILELVNKLRKDNNLEPLVLNNNLSRSAFLHSKDMADNNYFAHKSLDGTTPDVRAKRAGYNGEFTAENIAAGYKDADQTFELWKGSPEHLRNMLNKYSNEMGLGYASNRSSKYQHYWTQVFGKGSGTLSNDDFEEKVSLSVYPNPVKDNLNIKFNELLDDEIKIEIVSITGKIVLEQIENINKASISLNVENLTSGIYFLKINNANSLVKIVKL